MRLPFPPQFRLRTLLLAFAVISAVLAVAVRIGPVSSLAVGWTVLLIAAHVLGNAWGTKAKRLRLSGDDTVPPDDAPRTPATIRFAPATRLQRSGGLGWGVMALIAVGAAAGGVAGALVLLGTDRERHDYVGLALGICSAAALGGFFGFLTATSLGMAWRALREATRQEQTETMRN